MSRTSPSSSFDVIKEAPGYGIIYWDDGHSVSATSIEEAIAAGMKHFWDHTDDDNEHFIICSKEGLTSKQVKRAMKLWEQQCEFESEDEESRKGEASAAGEWSWNIQAMMDDEEEGDEGANDSDGLSNSLEDACKAIAKEIDCGFSINQLYEVEGQLFGDVTTGDASYQIMIEGPADEIKKLLKEKKIKR